MSRWRRWVVVGAILGGVVVVGPGEVGAQPWIGLGTWDGALEAGYAWDRQETKGDSGSNTKSGRTRYDERLTVRNTGAYYLDLRQPERECPQSRVRRQDRAQLRKPRWHIPAPGGQHPPGSRRSVFFFRL